MLVLDDWELDRIDFSDEAVEAFRRRTEAGEDPIDVVRDLNRRHFERTIDD